MINDEKYNNELGSKIIKFAKKRTISLRELVAKIRLIKINLNTAFLYCSTKKKMIKKKKNPLNDKITKIFLNSDNVNFEQKRSTRKWSITFKETNAKDFLSEFTQSTISNTWN